MQQPKPNFNPRDYENLLDSLTRHGLISLNIDKAAPRIHNHADFRAIMETVGVLKNHGTSVSLLLDRLERSPNEAITKYLFPVVDMKDTIYSLQTIEVDAFPFQRIAEGGIGRTSGYRVMETAGTLELLKRTQELSDFNFNTPETADASILTIKRSFEDSVEMTKHIRASTAVMNEAYGRKIGIFLSRSDSRVLAGDLRSILANQCSPFGAQISPVGIIENLMREAPMADTILCPQGRATMLNPLGQPGMVAEYTTVLDDDGNIQVKVTEQKTLKTASVISHGNGREINIIETSAYSMPLDNKSLYASARKDLIDPYMTQFVTAEVGLMRDPQYNPGEFRKPHMLDIAMSSHSQFSITPERLRFITNQEKCPLWNDNVMNAIVRELNTYSEDEKKRIVEYLNNNNDDCNNDFDIGNRPAKPGDPSQIPRPSYFRQICPFVTISKKNNIITFKKAKKLGDLPPRALPDTQIAVIVEQMYLNERETFDDFMKRGELGRGPAGSNPLRHYSSSIGQVGSSSSSSTSSEFINLDDHTDVNVILKTQLFAFFKNYLAEFTTHVRANLKTILSKLSNDYTIKTEYADFIKSKINERTGHGALKAQAVSTYLDYHLFTVKTLKADFDKFANETDPDKKKEALSAIIDKLQRMPTEISNLKSDDIDDMVNDIYNRYQQLLPTRHLRTLLPRQMETIDTYTARLKTTLDNPLHSLTALDTSSTPIQPEDDNLITLISNILPHVPDQGIDEFASFIHGASKVSSSSLSQNGVKSLVNAIEEKSGTPFVTEYLKTATAGMNKDKLEKFNAKIPSATEQRIQSSMKSITTNRVRNYLNYFKTATTPQSTTFAMDIDEPQSQLPTRHNTSMQTQNRRSTMDALTTGAWNPQKIKFRQTEQLNTLLNRVRAYLRRNSRFTDTTDDEIETFIDKVMQLDFSKETATRLAEYGCELFRLNYYKLGIQYQCSAATAVQSGGRSVHIGVAFPQTSFPHDGISNRLFIDVQFYMTAIVTDPRNIASELFAFCRGLVGGRTNNIIHDWKQFNQQNADVALCALPVPVNEVQYQFPMIMRTRQYPSVTEKLYIAQRPGAPVINPKQYCSAAHMLHYWIGENKIAKMADYAESASVWSKSQISLECHRACVWHPHGSDSNNTMRIVDGTGPIGSGKFNIPLAVESYRGNEPFPKDVPLQYMEITI